MILLIAGGRDMTNYDILCEGLLNFKEIFKDVKITGIVSGKARGADSLGERYAISNNIHVHEFPANWDKFGKRAGYIRNMEMAKFLVKNEGKALIFWDGVSRGTKNMIDILEAMNVNYIIRKYNKEELYDYNTREEIVQDTTCLSTYTPSITQKELSDFCRGDIKTQYYDSNGKLQYGIDPAMGRDFDGDRLIINNDRIFDKALTKDEVNQVYGYFRKNNPKTGGEWGNPVLEPRTIESKVVIENGEKRRIYTIDGVDYDALTLLRDSNSIFDILSKFNNTKPTPTKNGLQIPLTVMSDMLKTADSRLKRIHNTFVHDDILNQYR